MTATLSRAVLHSELTVDEIVKATRYLAKTSAALVETTRGLCAAQWDFKPAPDRWSIAENMEHVVLIENIVHGIIGNIGEAPAAADGPEELKMDEVVLTEVPKREKKFIAPDRIQPTGRWTGAQAVEQFLESRERTFELLSTSPLRGRCLPHPVFGPWDGYQWLLATAGHSARHTEQICEVKADANFPRPSH